jgi:uroporphyrinogen-III synthase
VSRKLEALKIVVPESREIDLLVSLLEAEGATAFRCPLVQILDVEDFAAVDAWTDQLLAGGFDDLVLFTGEGLRRLAKRADALGRKPDFISAIGRTRTIIRGPKPARALRELGLAPTLSAPSPTSQGLIEVFAHESVKGRNIAVQLYPGHGGDGLVDAVKAKGAFVSTVTPYRYASHTETEAVADVIRKMAAGAFDMIVFTSSPQVERLAEVAHERDLYSVLSDGLRRIHVAAIGPVVEDALKPFGLEHVIAPTEAFHLKPLMRAITAAWGRE